MMLRWYRTSVLVLLAVLTASLAFSGEGDALSQGKYKYSMQLSVTGYTGTTLTDFPLLVVLSTARTGFNYSQFKVADAGDLRFTDSSGRELAYELETWDTTGTSYAWVKLPTLTSSTTLNAFWGNAADSIPSYRTDGAAWDSNFIGVWHMNAVSPPDATSYANDGTGSGNTTHSGGIVAACQSFNANDAIAVDGVAGEAVASALSISALVKTSSGTGGEGDGHTFVSASEYLSGYGKALFGFAAGCPGSDPGEPCVYKKEGNDLVTTGDTGSTATISDDNWHHVAYVRNGSTGSLYVDGVEKGRDIPASYGFLPDDLWRIGALFDIGAVKRPLSGLLDEVRISKTVRNTDWMQAGSDVTRNHESFLDYADVEVAEKLGSVFFGW